MFLYRKVLHDLKQSRGEDPEMFVARIKQLAPAGCFTANEGTPNYGSDIMSTIFIIGLEYTYTKDHLRPVEGKTTDSFERLVDSTSDIAFYFK